MPPKKKPKMKIIPRGKTTYTSTLTDSSRQTLRKKQERLEKKTASKKADDVAKAKYKAQFLPASNDAKLSTKTAKLYKKLEKKKKKAKKLEKKKIADKPADKPYRFGRPPMNLLTGHILTSAEIMSGDYKSDDGEGGFIVGHNITQKKEEPKKVWKSSGTVKKLGINMKSTPPPKKGDWQPTQSSGQWEWSAKQMKMVEVPII